jgi:hypothetical protein
MMAHFSLSVRPLITESSLWVDGYFYPADAAALAPFHRAQIELGKTARLSMSMTLTFTPLCYKKVDIPWGDQQVNRKSEKRGGEV